LFIYLINFLPLVIFLKGIAGDMGSHLDEKLVARGHTVPGIDKFDPYYLEFKRSLYSRLSPMN
jgi:nucleoside-diphosphate-sugar epimerase